MARQARKKPPHEIEPTTPTPDGALDAVRSARTWSSLEDLVTCRDGFALPATPVQRAVCRVLDGLPLAEIGDDPAVVRSVRYSGQRPRETILLAGIRSGKSLIASAAILWWSLTCDASRLQPGERFRAAILSVEIDTAAATFSHLRAVIERQPSLVARLVEPPREHPKRSIILRRDDKREVEIVVVAGKRAGASLVARWFAGVVFDEAPRMPSQNDEYSVNIEESRLAVLGRILPGGGIIYAGSPHQPSGLIYSLVEESAPAPERALIRATGPDIAPWEWTPARCAEIERLAPRAYRTDVLCEWTEPEESLFALSALEACQYPGTGQAYQDGVSYVAAIDPASRSDAWTLVIVGRYGEDVHRVVHASQWRRERPAACLEHMAPILASYRLDWAITDQWSADALIDLARDRGIGLVSVAWTADRWLDTVTRLRAMVGERHLELPECPDILRDLCAVRRRAESGSAGWTVVLPRSGGRHCDYVPALGLALMRRIPAPVPADDFPGKDGRSFLERLAEAGAAGCAPVW